MFSRTTLATLLFSFTCLTTNLFVFPERAVRMACTQMYSRTTLALFLICYNRSIKSPVTVVCDIRSLALQSSLCDSTSSSSLSPYPRLVSCSCNHCFLTSCSISLFLFSPILFFNIHQF